MAERPAATGFWPSLTEPFREIAHRVSDWLAPASDASSDDQAYRITMELPGVEAADIRLTVEGGMATVKGEKRSARTERGETWYFTERQFGAFSRSFRLPADADDQAISATLRDGVLTITLPRAVPKAAERREVPIARG